MGRYERSAGMAALMNQGSTSRASDDHSPPSPTSQVAPYDDPENNYNAGDVAMENIYASPLTSPDAFSRGDKSGTYTSLNEPLGKHAADNISLLSHHSRHPHTKHFDHNQARKNLFKVGGYKLLITISFSALMCITLRAWEGFREPEILSKIEVRIFNAIMIGLSLCLGINLLASLQNYAGILRWSLLSRRYVSLEAFDLMLGLERLSNVFKLMIISLPLVRRQKYLRKLRIFKDARQDGTKWTWLVCLIWLGINVGSQLLVAVSSLFYPMETSQFPLLTYGNVTVADLTRWHSPAEDNATTLDFEAAWMYGMEAIVYPEFAPNDTQTDLSALPGMPLYKHESSYEYRFFNRNPVHPYSDYLLSNRSVFASATCQQVEIQDNFLLRNDTENSLHGKLPGEENYTKYYFPETAGGALTWIADFTSACGARCTNFTVIQANLTSTNITQPALFLCDSKVSEVKKGNDKHDITIRNNDDSNVVFGSNFWATVASGSMGWTGLPANGWFDRQYRTYTQGSKWSPAHPVNAKEVEDILMRFTIGAIAAFDDHGMRYNVTDQHVVPTPGQQLDVDWAYILSILGGICAMQFAALCCLVIFANRTIVRDESYFSVAMLLSPVVGRIGKEGGGMNMSGDEIRNHPKLQFKKIQYSYREGKNGEPHKVDILWEGKDSRESRKSWVAGVYN